MATNAPYYQMRSGQYTTTLSSTNATPPRLAPEADEYDTSASEVASSLEHPDSLYERSIRHTPANQPVNTPEENHHLAELLEAATTAAGQAAQAMDDHEAGTVTTMVSGETKRKRSQRRQPSNAAETPLSEATTTPKRRRVDMPTVPQLQNTDHDNHASSNYSNTPPSGESLLNDARTAGVHSAAAIFRRTSEKTTTRRYTRLPMSKLFMSLQLTPENFLQLQARAKTYMLDTTYPERQNCVGSRGKGDTDMVKLRLFNCVRDFLSDGAGEQFFGENVEKPGERDAIEAARVLGEDGASSAEEKLTWPRDGNKIISLVTPLMRRMVTNERQRMYAIETRKGGAKRGNKECSVEAVAQQTTHSTSEQHARGSSIEPQGVSALDPSLGQSSRTSRPASPSVSSSVTPSLSRPSIVAAPSPTVGDELLTETDLPLPTASPGSNLSNINIFLVLASSPTAGIGAKHSIKLDQTRLTSQQTKLINYPWPAFRSEVIKLLNRAKAKYPAVRERAVMQNHEGAEVLATGDSTDTLRELAVAANAMQADTAVSSSDSRAKESASVPDEMALLPRYVIKTVGPNGWEFVETAEQWEDLVSQRSRDVWADGVLNMIVEMVDVHVGEEGKEVV